MLLRAASVLSRGLLSQRGPLPSWALLLAAEEGPSAGNCGKSLLHQGWLSTSAAGGAKPDDGQKREHLHCRIVQSVKGRRLRLHVTGRNAKDFELELVRESVSEQRERKRQAGGRSISEQGFWGGMVRRLRDQAEATFLPAGYPDSVGPKFLEYSIWQSTTNFAVTANGVLASTFLLYSVGLGAGAIPTAGALNWVLKDGLGQVGTLLFGKTIAHNFDIHSKSWYFLSCLLLCFATWLEISTILVPSSFLIMGSLANMLKGLSWMAGGCTRSVFNLSYVRDNNVADITAKCTSQYIFASLLGTAAGVTMCAYIGQAPGLALIAFFGLANAALYSSYRTVMAIPLQTLNSIRLQLLAEQYLKCVGRDSIQPKNAMYINYQKEYAPAEDDDTCELFLPSPVELAGKDPPLPSLLGDRRILHPSIVVGTPLDDLVAGNPSLLVVLLSAFKYSRYLILPTDHKIHVVLHKKAGGRDIVQGYLQACILRKRLQDGMGVDPANLAEMRIILHDTLLTSEKLTGPFMYSLAKRGWVLDKVVVEAERARAFW